MNPILRLIHNWRRLTVLSIDTRKPGFATALLCAFTVGLSGAAAADPITIRAGRYSAGLNRAVEVKPIGVGNWYQIEVSDWSSGDTKRNLFFLDPDTASVAMYPGAHIPEGLMDSNLGTFLIGLRDRALQSGGLRLDLVAAEKTSTTAIFKWKRGGWFSYYEESLALGFDLASGSISDLDLKVRIPMIADIDAKTSGFHSGPFKMTDTHFICDGLLTEKAKVEETEVNLIDLIH